MLFGPKVDVLLERTSGYIQTRQTWHCTWIKYTSISVLKFSKKSIWLKYLWSNTFYTSICTCVRTRSHVIHMWRPCIAYAMWQNSQFMPDSEPAVSPCQQRHMIEVFVITHLLYIYIYMCEDKCSCDSWEGYQHPNIWEIFMLSIKFSTYYWKFRTDSLEPDACK